MNELAGTLEEVRSRAVGTFQAEFRYVPATVLRMGMAAVSDVRFVTFSWLNNISSDDMSTAFAIVARQLQRVGFDPGADVHTVREQLDEAIQEIEKEIQKEKDPERKSIAKKIVDQVWKHFTDV